MQSRLLNSRHPLIEQLREEWRKMVTANKDEAAYHSFLADHAGVFLVNGFDAWIAISKLKFGSDLEADFAVPHENASMGLIWNLIELERPCDPPFTSKGDPSARLNHALQQVRDWRRWLRDHRSLAQRMFCTNGIRCDSDPNFRFTIVIGTRENSERFIDKRNDLSRECGVVIRSFDSVADPMSMRVYWDRAYMYDGSWDSEYPELGIQLGNPFFRALGDSEWKKIHADKRYGAAHFHARACAELVRILKVNDGLEALYKAHAMSSQRVDKNENEPA